MASENFMVKLDFILCEEYKCLHFQIPINASLLELTDNKYQK